ncbi:MAG: aminopeptidase P family N-terminal domain-containing protein [Nitrososphaerota archaeon]|jgi:Xaa-Pro aminopeptidase|nr:aminopeptidase P family N-terminal domain-containing protein [Nitrososphaerota archaeon]
MPPNLSRAREHLSEHGVKALLTSSTMNVAYLTGFDCWLYQKYTENVLALGAPRERKEVFAVLAGAGRPVTIDDEVVKATTEMPLEVGMVISLETSLY